MNFQNSDVQQAPAFAQYSGMQDPSQSFPTPGPQSAYLVGPVYPAVYSYMPSMPHTPQRSTSTPTMLDAPVYSGHRRPVLQDIPRGGSVPHGGLVHSGQLPRDANLRRGSVQVEQEILTFRFLSIESEGKESPFIVHRCLLTKFSTYFRGLLAEKKSEVKYLVAKGYNDKNELDFNPVESPLKEEAIKVGGRVNIP